MIELRDEFERILRLRGYDRFADDEAVFQELLDELYETAVTCGYE